MMITFFGLFHGLATLPLILSLGRTEQAGPKTSAETNGHDNKVCVVEDEATRV